MKTSTTFNVPPLPVIDPSDYCTSDEAAALLHVDRRQIGKWIKRGELRAAKVGSRLFIPRSEVARFIASKMGYTGRHATA